METQYFVNVDKLIGKMAEKRITRKEMAKKLCVSGVTFKRYLDYPETMPVSVMFAIAHILCDNAQEAKDIFFCGNLHIA